jgi:hypothetical protein
VYTAWQARFPSRAEGYVRLALVWEQQRHDEQQARAILQTGIKQGAQPAGLLSFYLGRLKGSAPTASPE